MSKWRESFDGGFYVNAELLIPHVYLTIWVLDQDIPINYNKN